jgi:ADP-ribosylation factor related protein 1
VGKIVISGSIYKIWDLGGQSELHSIWEKFYLQCHAIIFVIDSSDKPRMETVRLALRTTTQYLLHVGFCKEKIVNNLETEGVPVLVMANKCDLPERLTIVDVKEMFNPIMDNIGAREVKVTECAAISG